MSTLMVVKERVVSDILSDKTGHAEDNLKVDWNSDAWIMLIPRRAARSRPPRV